MLKISVITVTFNCRNTLQRTIDSVLNQKYGNLEYIIVDGMSTDGTLDIIQENCLKANGIIRYISEKDEGLYDAMNKGIKMATGDIIGIINGDDYYTKNAFNEVLRLMVTTGADVVYSDMLFCRSCKVDFAHPLKAEHKKLVERMSVNHPTCFVRTTTYEKYGSFDVQFKIAADYEMMARFYKIGCHFEKSDRILAVMEPGGISSNNKRSIREKYIIHRKYFSKISAEIYRIRNTCLYYIRKIRK